MRDKLVEARDHPKGSALGDTRHMRARDREEIKRDGERHTVEVSTGDDVACTSSIVGKDQRIVRDSAKFAGDRALDEAKRIERRPENLRHRAQ